MNISILMDLSIDQVNVVNIQIISLQFGSHDVIQEMHLFSTKPLPKTTWA